jgi:hypothetical protein
MEFSKNVNWQTHTNGKGHWTQFEQTVTVTRVELAYVNDEGDFGELRAYFDTEAWDVNKVGLIYTDPRWIDEFRGLVRSLGFTRNACDDISYSEQGMQGDNYVSMDVGADFMREAEPMYRWTILRQDINSKIIA